MIINNYFFKVTKSYHRVTTILFLLLHSLSFGQCNPNSIFLNSTEVGNVTHIAQEKIVILPDYSFDGAQGNGHYYINNCMDYSGFPSNQDMEASVDEFLPVGSINGSHGVDESGGANYSIEIEIPKGVNGMEPTLGINYNSFHPNGILGVGWSLSGSSIIAQGGSNWYFDNDAETIQLDGSGKLNIDGHRLFLLGTNNNNDGNIYTTELETYEQIISKGLGATPDYFIVSDKSGLTREYGVTQSSKFLSPVGEPIAYAINKISDRHGNYIKYEYFDDNSLRIKKISYTGNEDENINPSNIIRFYYSERQDKNIQYLAGTGMKNNFLLDKIVIYSDYKHLKDYQFNYGTNLYSYLTSISVTSFDNVELNKTLFQYGDKNEFTLESTSSFTGLTSADLFKGGDFNGDGLEDVLVKHWYFDGNTKIYSSWKAFTSNGDNTFSHYAGSLIPQGFIVHYSEEFSITGQASTFDFDGDGKSDILLYSLTGSQNELTLNELLIQRIDDNGSINTFNVPFSPGGWYDPNKSIQVGDFDGDGRDDILLFRRNSVNEYSGKMLTIHGGEQNLLLNGLTYLNAADDVIVMDFDGDSKNDLLVLYPNSAEIFELSPQNNNGFYEEKKVYHSDNPGFPTIYHTIYTGDFNGDGKTDLLTSGDNENWFIAYSTGEGYTFSEFNFVHDYSIGSNDNFLLIDDINMDGKSDIIHITHYALEHSIIDIFYSSGTQFEYNTTSVDYITSLNDIFPGDFNGDGKKSLFNRDFYQSPASLYSFNKDGQDNLLTRVKDGYGNIVEFNYKSLAQDQEYTFLGASSFPVNDIRIAMPVVKEVKSPDGIGGENIESYKYFGGKWHRNGKGFLGFMRISHENTANNVKSINNYSLYQSPFYPKFITKVMDNNISENTVTGQLISSSSFNFDIIHLSDYRFKKEMINHSITDHVRDNNINMSYTYDNFGNIKIKEVVNSVETHKEYFDYSSEGWWIPSYLKKGQNIITRGLESYERIVEYSYGDNGVMTNQISDPGSNFEINTLFFYDDLGNVIGERVSSFGLPTMNIEYEYDNKGIHLINKIDANGKINSFTYDTRIGKVVKLFESGTQTFSFNYDSFGSLLSSIDEQGVIATYEYEWDLTNDINSLKEPINTLYKHVKSIEGKPKQIEYFDILGRQVKSEVEGQSGDIFNVTKFNSSGKKVSVTQPFYNYETPYLAVFNYDEYGRLISNTDGIKTTNYNYETENGLYKITSELSGIETTKFVDASDKTVKTIDLGGIIENSYHPSGNINETKINGVIVSTQEYDLLGNKTKQIEINSGESNFVYDSYNNLINHNESRGYQTFYEYDNLNRLITETSPSDYVIYSYFTGKHESILQKVVHSNGTILENTVDDYGQIIEKKIIKNGEVFAYQYEYNEFGDVIQKIYPSGLVVKMNYDSKGYLSSITNEDETISFFSEAQYNSKGNIIKYHFGNELAVEKDYNDYGSLISIYTDGIQHYEMTIDQITGNVTRRVDNLIDRKEDFIYDTQNRLIDSRVSFINSNLLAATPVNIDYFQNGNIENKSDAGFNYVYDDEKIHAVTNVENVTQNIPSFEQNLEFNELGFVNSISENNWNYDIEYGANGDRILTKLYDNGNLVKEKLYLGLYEREINDEGEIKEINYIHTPDGIGCAVVISDGLSSFFYFHKDHLNSIVSVTNEQGLSVFNQSFDPWGNKRNPITWENDNLSSNIDFSWVRGFTGHEHLDEFGLINMNHRLYDPVLGRMLGPDNYVSDNFNTQSFNRYTYANNNPLGYTDPSGDFAFPFILPVIGAAAIGGTIGAWYYNQTDRNPIVGAFNGAIIGAQAGLLFSGLGAQTFAYGKAIKPLIAGKVPMGQGLNKGIAILQNSLQSAVMNMGTYTLRTTITQEEWSWQEFSVSAGIGLGSGLIGGSTSLFDKSNAVIQSSSLRTMSYTTNILNGTGLRFSRAKFMNESVGNVIKHTIFGAAEGAMASFMVINNDLPLFIGKNKDANISFTQLIFTSGTGSFITGIPGLSSMLFNFYLPTFAGINTAKNVSGNFNWGAAGFVSISSIFTGLIGDQPSSYPTTIGNFQIKPYGWNNLLRWGL